jgi:uncharacterized phage protein gp47/JayE
MTREEIKNRMLSHISDEYDKSDGSFFHDVINALAIELEAAYTDQNHILDQGFVETAKGQYLDKKASEQGLYRKPPIKANTTVTIKGSEGVSIKKGMEVASDSASYIIKENKTIDSTGQVNVLVECEKAGTIGNVPLGAIKSFPRTIAGLESVTNPSKVTNGYNGESDEELRNRYYSKVKTPATSGNKNHYRNWALEVPGVGDARIIPLWNGNGTVRVVIIDSEKTGADQELVDKVKEYIEKNRPIGADVTVESAIELSINIAVALTIDTNNYTMEQVLKNVENNIKKYLKEIAFVEDYVSYAQIGSLIFQTKGVVDYSNLTVNNGNKNIPLTNTSIAVLGVITNV